MLATLETVSRGQWLSIEVVGKFVGSQTLEYSREKFSVCPTALALLSESPARQPSFLSRDDFSTPDSGPDANYLEPDAGTLGLAFTLTLIDFCGPGTAFALIPGHLSDVFLWVRPFISITGLQILHGVCGDLR
jgi:hypothetical protein